MLIFQEFQRGPYGTTFPKTCIPISLLCNPKWPIQAKNEYTIIVGYIYNKN